MTNQVLYCVDVEYLIDRIDSRIKENYQKALSEREQENTASTQLNGLYTRKETAKILRISLPTLHNRINRGDIATHRIGGRTVIKAQDIEKSLIQQQH